MKYMLLLYGSESYTQTPQEFQAEIAEYGVFSAEATQRGIMLGGEALQPTATATIVSVRDGKTITTDGPFAETHEQLGGYYLLDCKNLDEAIEMAAKIPAAKNGKVEIRPLMVWEQ